MIENLFNKNPLQYSPTTPSSISQQFKKIYKNIFSNSNKGIEKNPKKFTCKDLEDISDDFFNDMIKNGTIADSIKFLDRLSDIIPLSKTQETTKDNAENALNEAKGMLEEAKLYLQTTNKNNSPNIQMYASSILDGIISLVENVVEAFGISDFFKSSENELQSDFKSNKVMMLLSLFSMITSLILPTLGTAVGSLIVGGTLLAIAAISIIWPFIKPVTTHLPANAENWTKQIQNGGLVAQGRKESLDQIANILKMNRHAILVGPSRVGKSLTAKAFSQAVERGDYPELKGKVIFRINTTDLIDQKASFLGGGNKILYEISSKMGRHRDNIILVLDEIHMACKNNEKIADQLKTFLDENGEFPHVIGITTDEEYDEHVKNNNAFSLRFDKVDIKNTNKDETLRILAETCLRSRSKPLMKEGVLEKIYELSNKGENAPQPSSSIKLLKKCINKTENTQISPKQENITKISNKITSLRYQSTVTRNKKEEINKQIDKLENELNQFNKQFNEEKKELDKLFKSKELLDHVTKEIYSSILKISKIATKTLNSENEKQLKRFILLHKFLEKPLISYIEKKSEELKINAVIDEKLVNQLKD